jgi:methyl-accepting chemotaxis protein
MVQEIQSATEEQARGVSEITRAMQQLDEATQQNSGTSQQTQAFAVGLSEQADLLNGIVGSIETEIFGNGSQKAA